MTPDIDRWLRPFNLDASLHAHTAEVVASLPQHVRDDFMDDPAAAIPATIRSTPPTRWRRGGVSRGRIDRASRPLLHLLGQFRDAQLNFQQALLHLQPRVADAVLDQEH